MNQPWVNMCSPSWTPPSYLPPHPIPQGHPSEPALSTLSHASNLSGDLFHIWCISKGIQFSCFSWNSSGSGGWSTLHLTFPKIRFWATSSITPRQVFFIRSCPIYFMSLLFKKPFITPASEKSSITTVKIVMHLLLSIKSPCIHMNDVGKANCFSYCWKLKCQGQDGLYSGQVYWHLLLFSMFLPRRLAGCYWRILFIWLHRNQALSLARIHWNCRTKSIPRIWCTYTRIGVFPLFFCGGRFFILFFSSKKIMVKKQFQHFLSIDNKYFRVQKNHIPLFKDRL